MNAAIRTERRGRVLEVTIDRPKANAIDAATSRIMGEIFASFRDDPALRVAILTAAGEKFFCPGWDLKAAADGEPPDADYGVGGFGGLQELPGLNKPVICAVNGMAVGGGLHFVADSDIVIAAGHATFFDTHVKVGLVAGLEPVSLARRMPLEAVLRMALVGGAERIDAAQAHALGLVGEVVPAELLLSRAHEVADMIKRHSPAALRRTKQAIWGATERGLTAGLEHAWQLIMEQNAHPDMQEGGSAFLERRAPRWRPPSER